jgi:hypothetical protein
MAEMVIQQLLVDAGADAVDPGLVSVAAGGLETAADWSNLRSPETYLGTGRIAGFASPDDLRSGEPQSYSPPTRLRLNQWAPTGTWTVAPHAAVSNEPAGRIAFRFHARDLHLVMGPVSPDASIRFRVLLDGESPGPAHGGDVDADGNGVLEEQRLHQLIRQPGPITERDFEIEFADAGAEAYCFTFG